MTHRWAAALRRIPVLTFLLSGCVGVPDGVTPVSDFSTEKYLGTWYEIARLDHSFERGLDNVKARYSLLDDGSIRVSNSGRKAATGEWKKTEGRAKIADDETRAHLKVSFFGPFYSSYVVFSLDPDYQIAHVSGFSRKYLWLLARQPQISDAEKQRFLDSAAERGFDTSELIWVKHRQPD